MLRFLLFSLILFISNGIFSQEVLQKKSNDYTLVSIDEIQVYPNPTSDIFYFKNDEQVSKVVLYSILGKEVKRFAHTPGTGYSVIDLQKGIYVLRIFNEKDKILKVLRLHRK